ncbi:hypothetical protein [Dongia sp.]|uniref:hypothetical protein n=1 Tax=Dongia sp. TaxID=1977262 RepID=UPI0035B13E62
MIVSRVYSRYRHAMAILLTALAWAAAPARAERDCTAVPGIVGEIDSFLAQAAHAQGAGSGTMPIDAVLFGVTEIGPEDRQELDTRDRVQLQRRTASGGDYANRGPERITVEGIFAERETLFRLPELILGRYRLEPGGATLTYDPDHTVEVGERVLGIPFFMEVGRMSVSREKLAFYFSGNDGDEPDRCYKVE